MSPWVYPSEESLKQVETLLTTTEAETPSPSEVTVPYADLRAVIALSRDLVDQCNKVGLPMTAEGLVKHHRANAALAGTLTSMTQAMREGAVRALRSAAEDPSMLDERDTLLQWIKEIEGNIRPVTW